MSGSMVIKLSRDARLHMEIKLANFDNVTDNLKTCWLSLVHAVTVEKHPVVPLLGNGLIQDLTVQHPVQMFFFWFSNFKTFIPDSLMFSDLWKTDSVETCVNKAGKKTFT